MTSKHRDTSGGGKLRRVHVPGVVAAVVGPAASPRRPAARERRRDGAVDDVRPGRCVEQDPRPHDARRSWHPVGVQEQSPETIVAAADAALAEAEWERAAELCHAALAERPGDADLLDRLGQAEWWIGDLPGSVARRTEAYAAYARRGERRAASRVALWLAAEDARGPSIANGWLARAQRMLEGLPPDADHGRLEVRRAKWAADPAVAEAHAHRALELARAANDLDLEVSALCQVGIAHIARGRVAEGMTQLDAAMAAAMAGEATDPWAIGDACCQMLTACDRLSDLERAADWCRRVIEFTERRRYTPLSGLCRASYAGVLTTMGDWERAESELLASRRTFAGTQRDRDVIPLAGLAELRLRQGRIDEAARLLAGHEDDAVAQPAVVALALARGDAAVAAQLAERALDIAGFRSPVLASLLSLLVRARIALGDVDAARDAAGRLGELALGLRQEHVAAHAEVAAAAVCAAKGDGAPARHLEVAVEIFERLGMPLEEGRARLALARALAAGGSAPATQQARAALDLFERLGAAADADGAASFLRAHGSPGRVRPRSGGELTTREREVLALLADGLTNPQIAERLFISRKTAGHHVSRILMKVGARNRAEAAAYAVREQGAGQATG